MVLDEIMQRYLSLGPDDVTSTPASIEYAHSRGGASIFKIPSDVLKKKNLDMVTHYVSLRKSEYCTELSELEKEYTSHKACFGDVDVFLDDRLESRGALRVLKTRIAKVEDKLFGLSSSIQLAKIIVHADISLDLVPNEMYYLYDRDNKLRLQRLSPIDTGRSDGFVASLKVLSDYTLQQVYLLTQ